MLGGAAFLGGCGEIDEIWDLEGIAFDSTASDFRGANFCELDSILDSLFSILARFSDCDVALDSGPLLSCLGSVVFFRGDGGRGGRLCLRGSFPSGREDRGSLLTLLVLETSFTEWPLTSGRPPSFAPIGTERGGADLRGNVSMIGITYER